MTIFLGADHRGFELKKALIDWLLDNGFEIEDKGADEFLDNDDFIEYAVSVGEEVAKDKAAKGIVICGSGAGVEIAANKVNLVRCSLGQSVQQITKAREADDINILAIAADFTDSQKAKDLVEAFLKTPFIPSENHLRRIEKINNIE